VFILLEFIPGQRGCGWCALVETGGGVMAIVEVVGVVMVVVVDVE